MVLVDETGEMAFRRLERLGCPLARRCTLHAQHHGRRSSDLSRSMQHQPAVAGTLTVFVPRATCVLSSPHCPTLLNAVLLLRVRLPGQPVRVLGHRCEPTC